LAVLIGALASAEERQIGTLEWQVLLPMAAWRQWAVKVGTALGLAALLSFGLPILLAGGHVDFNSWHVLVIMVLTTGGLYVSTLCKSAVRALIVAAPLMLGVTVLALYVMATSAGVGRISALFAAPIAGVVVPMLWFAFENHRLAGQSAARVFRQAMWIAGCLALGAGIVRVLP